MLNMADYAVTSTQGMSRGIPVAPTAACISTAGQAVSGPHGDSPSNLEAGILWHKRLDSDIVFDWCMLGLCLLHYIFCYPQHVQSCLSLLDLLHMSLSKTHQAVIMRAVVMMRAVIMQLSLNPGLKLTLVSTWVSLAIGRKTMPQATD